MSPDTTPEPLDAEGRSNDSPLPAGVVGAIGGIALGLVVGYVIGQQNAPKPAIVAAANTATAVYAPDTTGSEPPTRLGKVPVRALASLEDWDPLDPFDGGFPLPPGGWTPPLLALNPPIPVPAAMATQEGTANPGDRPGSFSTAPPPIRGDFTELPPMAPPSMGGTEVVPLNPGAPGAGATDPGVPQSTGSVLVTGTLTGVNERAAQATIAALGAKYGGASRSFTHMGVEGDVEAEGVLLLVAPSDVDKAVSDIRKLGAMTAEDRSEGTIRSRQSRLSSIFASRLTTLRKRREELLVQFLEDADPIKQLDAAIDREARALSAVRLSGATDRLAAIRILLKS